MKRFENNNAKKFLILVMLAFSFIFLSNFSSAYMPSSMWITADYNNCGSSTATCPSSAVAGAVRVPPSGGTCNEVYGTNSEFPKKKALIGPGEMTLCSLQGPPYEQDSLFIISKNDDGNIPYCTTVPTALFTNLGQPGPGECPTGYHASGSFRVGQGISGSEPRGWDYCGNIIVNGNLTLCTKEDVSLLIWSNDCGQTPETNYTEACLGINQGGFHVGPGTSACSQSTIYGVSASGKTIKSGWVYLCLGSTSRSVPPADLPTPALQPYFNITNSTPNNKAYNISSQSWFFIDVGAVRAYTFPDYFEFEDELRGLPECDPEFEPYARLTAASTAVQGLPAGGKKTIYASQTFNCSNDISRADASIFLVRSLNLTIDTSGGPHYGDVPSTHPAYAAVETLYNKGIRVDNICGGGLFCENNSIKRKEFAVWVAEALDLPDSPMNTSPTYCDVPTNYLNYSAIENISMRIVAAGEFGGSCGASSRWFRPDKNLDRQQIGKFLVNSARNCLVEINGTNRSMDLGVYTYCSHNFTGITLQGKELIEYNYSVWAGDIVGYLNKSVSRRVIFYSPSCSLTADPSTLPLEGGTSTIRIAYRNLENPSLSQSADNPKVNCGNGNSIEYHAENDQTHDGLHDGNYTATCSYDSASEPQTYAVTAAINGISPCTSTQVRIAPQLPQVNFLDVRCPMQLVTENSAEVSVELVQNGERACDSQIALDIKITDPNGIQTTGEYTYTKCDASTNNFNVFNITTETDGLYQVTASRPDFETSKCNFRVFHQRAASIPELNPLALLATVALAFAFLHARRGARGN